MRAAAAVVTGSSRARQGRGGCSVPGTVTARWPLNGALSPSSIFSVPAAMTTTTTFSGMDPSGRNSSRSGGGGRGTDSGAVGTVTAVGAEGVRGGAVTPPRLRAWGPGRPRRGLPGAALKGGGETRGSVLGQVGGRGGRRRGPGSTCAVPLRRLPGGSAGGGGRTHPVATGLPVVSASQLRCPGGGGGGWVGGDGDRQAGRPWPFPAAAARRRGVWELQGWELARPTPGCWGVRVRPCLFLTKKGGDSLPRCAATQPHCGAEGRAGGWVGRGALHPRLPLFSLPPFLPRGC